MFPLGVLGLYLPHDLFEVQCYTRCFMVNGIPDFQEFSHTGSLLFFGRHLSVKDLYFYRFAFGTRCLMGNPGSRVLSSFMLG